MRSTKILIILLLSWTLPAQADERCPSTQGRWLTSQGQLVCRSCPAKQFFLAQRPLKLPENCTSLKPGVFLSTPLYKELRSSQQFALELKSFQESLNPSLERFSQQIVKANDAVTNLKKVLQQTHETNLRLEKRISTVTAHRAWLIYISSGLGIYLGALTYFAILN